MADVTSFVSVFCETSVSVIDSPHADASRASESAAADNVNLKFSLMILQV